MGMLLHRRKATTKPLPTKTETPKATPKRSKAKKEE